MLQIDTRKNQKGKCYVHIIINWTNADVWNFINHYKLITPDIYTDCQTARGGCIGCPMSHNQKHELDANPKYKAAYISAIQKGIDNGGIAKFMDAQDVLDWWIYGNLSGNMFC